MNKTMVILCLGPCLLAACATPLTREQLAGKAREETTPNLCAITLMAPPLSVLNAAENEIRARNATCDWTQAQAIAETQIAARQARAEEQQARAANAAAMFGAASVLLQESAPRTLAPAPVTTTCHQAGYYLNCTSY